MKIIADAGPLLSFARAGRLDLLREVVSALIIPEAVYEEVVVQGAGKPGAHDVRHASWITRARVQDRSLVDALPGKLHQGEREALALAKELDGVLLVDEYAVRQEFRFHSGLLASAPPGVYRARSLQVLRSLCPSAQASAKLCLRRDCLSSSQDVKRMGEERIFYF